MRRARRGQLEPQVMNLTAPFRQLKLVMHKTLMDLDRQRQPHLPFIQINHHRHRPQGLLALMIVMEP
jgi:hypothetical protein